MFYVYEWIRLDTNEPFYVGKGRGERWRKLTRGNNHHFNNIVKSVPVSVVLLHEELDETTAFEYEVFYINEYKNLGYDLTNITDGGTGGVVAYGKDNFFYGKKLKEILSEESYQKWYKKKCELSKGKSNPMYGVSPKDRMDSDTYEIWLQKIKERDVSGKNNPNYGNTKLKDYYKDNPEEKKKLARKGGQNGRAKGVEIYDSDMNFIEQFSYIRECSLYLLENQLALPIHKSMRTIDRKVADCMRDENTYNGFYFKHAN